MSKMIDPRGRLQAASRLDADERREAEAEELGRMCGLIYPPLDDETIDRIADGSFLEYDAREAEDAGQGHS